MSEVADPPPADSTPPADVTPADSTPPADNTPPADPPAPWHQSIFNDEGGFGENWQDNLPSEFDEYKATLANYKDFGALAKSLKDSKAAAMAKNEGMIKLPGEDASDEDLAAFRSALGVPEAPEGYEITAPENLPEGVEFDEELAGNFAQVAHGLNLPPAAVQKLVEWNLEQEHARAVAGQAEMQQLIQGEQDKLKQAFGNNYEKGVTDAKRAAALAGIDPDHPAFGYADIVSAFATLAGKFKEDQLPSSEDVNKAMSPSTVAADIRTNENHPMHAAYWDGTHPKHQEVVKYVLQQEEKAVGS